MWQFLTIHPYLDGNGRTARALATYILRQHGLWLKGLFILESYYDRHLSGYYKKLQMGLSHNYYFGRNDADLTPWLSFFIDGMAEVFQEAADLVRTSSQSIIDGFIKPRDEQAKRIRTVVLTTQYEELAEEIRLNADQYKYLLI